MAASVVSEFRGLQGIDTSGVEVADDEQSPPSIAAGSAEEAAKLKELEGRLSETGAMEAWLSFKETTTYKELPLMCLRGRKYDVERAADILPKLVELMREFDVGTGKVDETLAEHLKALTIVSLDVKDDLGRGILWLRLRNHDPKTRKKEDLVRQIITVQLHLLQDADVQRLGIVVIHDMNGLGLKNLDPGAAKLIFSRVLTTMPIRVGRVCVINPPWIVGRVIIPIVMTFMSSKIKSRFRIIHSDKVEAVEKFVPIGAIPDELGGQYAFDSTNWSRQIGAA